MKFEFHLEWEEAPGVRDPVLARTWARLELRYDGRPLTRFWSERSRSLRDGVYGSIFPLARWAADNWWFLLDEPPRSVRSATRSMRDQIYGEESRGWLERHNPLLSREGMPYPDITICRLDPGVSALHWTSDPTTTTINGRFVDSGAIAIARTHLEAALEGLIESVVQRTLDLDVPDVIDMREVWAAIVESRDSEPVLCARMAMLGVDPYATESDPSLEELVGNIALPDVLISDILASSTPSLLAGDISVATRLKQRVPSRGDIHANNTTISRRLARDIRAYEAGFARAREFRRDHGLGRGARIDSFPDLLEAALGSRPNLQWIDIGADRSSIDALVQFDDSAFVAATVRALPAQRFLLGRALHHLRFVAQRSTPARLLTRGHEWNQAASRSFAAELLAPAEALSVELASGANSAELASAFGVDIAVIEYQIQNHDLIFA